MPSCRHRDSLVGFRRILFMVRASGIHCTNRQLSDYFVDISKGNRTACVVTGFWAPGTTSGVQPVANRQGTHLHLRSHRPVFFTATQGIGGGRSGRRIAMQPQVKNQRNSWSCGLASYHAVSSTFAGNLIIIGSIANLIVIEQASNYGIKISFKEHAAVGIPVTLFSLAVLVIWIYA